jgi:hypothetical protein
MKTKVEIEGYEIEIEFVNGVISVKAEKDEEVVEEFSIEVEEGQSEDDEEVQGFGEYGQDEEEDFESQDESDDDESDDEFEGGFGEGEEGEEDEESSALESFQSFINKKSK